MTDSQGACLARV